MATTMHPTAPVENADFQPRLRERHRFGTIWLVVFQASTLIGIVALIALLYNIFDSAFGIAAIEYKIDPASLAVNGVALDDLEQPELVRIFQENVSAGLYRRYDRELTFDQRTREDVLALIYERVLEPQVSDTWPFFESLLNYNAIVAEAHEKYPSAIVEMRSWLTPQFITNPQEADPLRTGLSFGILGSLMMIGITVLVAFPLGVMAAIYLQEYATDNWINRIIQTNINNLAGVPSIIYGMLGLALFVRALGTFTSGAAFGVVEATATINGRTILSAAMTLALLILPVIIINSQEAIKAVPNSLRQASYGLGATKWQTVWSHVLPNSMTGILTGTILAISRAFGETAPLVVVGAFTYITFAPSSPFSNFTALPIMIYDWASRPQQEYRNIAAAAIIVLMALLLTSNATAIILRNRFRRTW